MRVSAITLFTLGSVVLAQVDNTPQCVVTCVQYATTASTCQDLSSLGCLCTDKAFINAAAECYAANCTPEETAIGINSSIASCGQIGVSVSVPSIVASDVATSGSVSAATTTETTVSAASSTPSVAPAPSSSPVSVASETPAPSPSATQSSGAGKTAMSACLALAGVAAVAFVF